MLFLVGALASVLREGAAPEARVETDPTDLNRVGLSIADVCFTQNNISPVSRSPSGEWTKLVDLMVPHGQTPAIMHTIVQKAPPLRVFFDCASARFVSLDNRRLSMMKEMCSQAEQAGVALHDFCLPNPAERGLRLLRWAKRTDVECTANSFLSKERCEAKAPRTHELPYGGTHDRMTEQFDGNHWSTDLFGEAVRLRGRYDAPAKRTPRKRKTWNGRHVEYNKTMEMSKYTAGWTSSHNKEMNSTMVVRWPSTKSMQCGAREEWRDVLCPSHPRFPFVRLSVGGPPMWKGVEKRKVYSTNGLTHHDFFQRRSVVACGNSPGPDAEGRCAGFTPSLRELRQRLTKLPRPRSRASRLKRSQTEPAREAQELEWSRGRPRLRPKAPEE